jgi:DNA-directed RNA polymerase specialized sigma24 family protein
LAASQKEIELVKACQQNDRQAQNAFYNLYKGRLMGVCRRYARTLAEAEDIFQEAFIKIFQHLGSLTKSRVCNVLGQINGDSYGY